MINKDQLKQNQQDGMYELIHFPLRDQNVWSNNLVSINIIKMYYNPSYDHNLLPSLGYYQLELF
jgi:hypothetical protein